MRLRRRSSGFTLVELLVVIAIIGILVALLLPAVQAAREAARRMQCTNQLKQLTLATHNYHDSHSALPLGSLLVFSPKCPATWTGSQQLTWIARILPYIEQQSLYDQIDFSRYAWWSVNCPTREAASAELPTVRCPSAEPLRPRAAYGPTNYVACTGRHARTWPGKTIPWTQVGMFQAFTDGDPNYTPFVIGMANIGDGTSNTMCLSECLINEPWISRPGSAGYAACLAGTDAPITDNSSNAFFPRGASWMRDQYGQTWSFSTYFPPNDPLHENHECYAGGDAAALAARSEHPGGVNASMADGSVRFISDTINLNTWRAISTVQGGEVAGDM